MIWAYSNLTSQAKDQELPPPNEKSHNTHLKAAIYEMTPKFLYRRAFSESKLLDALGKPGFYFEDGHVYNFITAGDIDALSFLKAVIRQQNLEHVLASTWCMSGNDILQFQEWINEGKIKHLDIYVGEIFPSSYSVEWGMLKELYRKHNELGRIALFRNHSKVFAGTGRLFSFGIQSSANINTNPRTEQASITIDRGIYEFYKSYYDGIRSFEDNAL